MKRNRRVVKSPRRTCHVADSDAPFLFSSKNSDPVASVVVPETPTSSPCPSATLATISNMVSVMETPDDVETKSHAQDLTIDKQETGSGESAGSLGFLDMDEPQELDITPNLNLVRRKKLLSILESEHSFTSSLQSQKEKNSSMLPHHNENGRTRKKTNTSKDEIVSPKIGRKRRSLAQVILPFDLNDSDRLSNKLNMLNDLEHKRRLSSPSAANQQIKGQNRKRSLNFPSTPAVQRRRLKSYGMLMTQDKKEVITRSSTKMQDKVTEDKTIHFDSDDIILTPVQDIGKNGVQAADGNNTNEQNKEKNVSVLGTAQREDQGYSFLTSKILNSLSTKGACKSIQKMLETSEELQVGHLNNNPHNVNDSDTEKQETPVPSVDPITVLKGVVAYVEVRMENDNRSGVIKDQLRALGADVCDRLSLSVTHVIFKDGSKSVFMRARKRGLHLLSSLWVEACRVKLAHVPESLYPSCSIEHYTTSFMPGRLRKMRSMQPKEFSEEEQLAAKRAHRRRLKYSANSPPETTPATTTTYDQPVFFTPQTHSRIPTEDISSPLFGISHLLTPQRRASSTSSSSEENEKPGINGGCEVEEHDDYKTPLAMRLYNRFFSPKAESEPRNCRVISAGRKNPLSSLRETLSSSNAELNRLEMVSGGIENMECQITESVCNLRNEKHCASDQSLENNEVMASLRIISDTDSRFTIDSFDLPVRLDTISSKPGTSRNDRVGENKRHDSVEHENSDSDDDDKRKDAEKRISDELKDPVCKEDGVRVSDSGTSNQLSESCRKKGQKCKKSEVERLMENCDLSGTSSSICMRKKAHVEMGKILKQPSDMQSQRENSVSTQNETNLSLSDIDVPPLNRYISGSSELANSQRVIKGNAANRRKTRRHSMRNSLPCMPESPEMTCSQARRHKLLSVDSLEPSQELVVPITPKREDKRYVGAYTELQVVDSRTQRKAIRDQKDISNCIPLPRTSLSKLKSKSSYSTSTVEDTVKSTRCEDEQTDVTDTQKSLKRRQQKPSVKQLKKSSTPSGSEMFSSEDSVFGEGTITPLPHPRRSTEEFRLDDVPKPKRRRNTKSRSTKLMSICLTSFHSEEKSTVVPIIRKLGGSEMSEEVGLDTTHVVCGSERRTLSLLLGIARGCWILSVAWLYESLEMGAWVPEEAFEVFVFAPAAKICRERRLSQGGAYSHTLFSGVGSICVMEGCSPPAAFIKELLMLCGATVVGSVRCANLVVGAPLHTKKQRHCAGPTHISEKWVLDCVMQHKILPTSDYDLKG